MRDELDDDDGDGKRVVYIPRSAVRSFGSANALRKWVLSMLERGHYIRHLRVSAGAEVVFDGAGTDAPPDESTALATAHRRGGRPQKAKKSHESKAEEKRRKARDRQRRYRERKAKTTP